MFDRALVLAAAGAGAAATMMSDMLALAPMVDTGSQRRAMAGFESNRRSRFDPRINRHTGKPHEHRREIARNVARKGVAA